MEMDYCYYNEDALAMNKSELYMSSSDHLMRASFDSGFDSMLRPSSSYDECDDSSGMASWQSSPMSTCGRTSIPSTPSKQPTTSLSRSNSTFSFTPIKKCQIADVNGMYLACIKSPLKSPTNYFGTDNYIRERDTATANLLRSPAIKSATKLAESPVVVTRKIKCKNFFQVPTVPTPVTRTTPTEEEFLELLFKNHLSCSTDRLIGARMGLESFDILGELAKRGMCNVVDQIMGNLCAADYTNMYNVSRGWRDIITQDKRRNKERVRYIRYKKKFIESTKENLTGVLHIVKGKKQRRSSTGLGMSGCLGRLDINCLNSANVTMNSSELNEFSCNYSEQDIHLDDSVLAVGNQSKMCSESLDFRLNISDDRSRVYLNESVYMSTATVRLVSPVKSALKPSLVVKMDMEPSGRCGGKSVIIESPVKSPGKCFKIKTDKICSKLNKKNLKRL